MEKWRVATLSHVPHAHEYTVPKITRRCHRHRTYIRTCTQVLVPCLAVYRIRKLAFFPKRKTRSLPAKMNPYVHDSVRLSFFHSYAFFSLGFHSLSFTVHVCNRDWICERANIEVAPKITSICLVRATVFVCSHLFHSAVLSCDTSLFRPVRMICLMETDRTLPVSVFGSFPKIRPFRNIYNQNLIGEKKNVFSFYSLLTVLKKKLPMVEC